MSDHTPHLWPDLDAGLREVRWVLRPSGPPLLAFDTSENAANLAEFPDQVYTLRSRDEATDAMRQAGFADASLAIEAKTRACLARACS